MRIIIIGLMVTTLTACSVQQFVTKNDEKYLRPGALDLPLGRIYNTYQLNFLNKYRIAYQWPANAATCRMGALPTLHVDRRYFGEVFEVPAVFEADGKTWQISPNPSKPDNVDRFVRSVKIMNPTYGKINGVRQKTGDEEIEVGLQSMCFDSWYVSSHALIVRLHKWDVATWRANWTLWNPAGKWSQQRVGGNFLWTQTIEESALAPRRPGAAGGWFQGWLVPIGDTGYTMAISLGASQESLEYPIEHERMKTTLRHIVESVRIEPMP
ncbi:hypothetical protein [Rugamonas rubra]|uniref:Uncharacterized protein n=1 Tax=Rugamonas rubra TaxID=758825 RepID=A0A1I4S5V5_9BURK|nr:hypothetical protein [Rugamonas rubra]SFM59888.1 hypothetical protein SAMN02982985_04628 [Rugamonas rubra]